MAIEYRDKGQLIIQADLPGLRDGDLTVSITGDVLHIRAIRPDASGDPTSDLRYGSFMRDIALPPNTDERDVSATYNGPMLEVRAPIGHTIVSTRTVPVVWIDAAATA